MASRETNVTKRSLGAVQSAARGAGVTVTPHGASSPSMGTTSVTVTGSDSAVRRFVSETAPRAEVFGKKD